MSGPLNVQVGALNEPFGSTTAATGSTGGTTTTKPKSKPKGSTTPGLNKKQQQKIEEEYGLSYGLFKAFPELNQLLGQAVKANWTAAKFQVELRQTDWFKTHSDTWRQRTALKYADPATYNERLNQSVSNFNNLAASVGVHLSPGAARAMAERAYLFGWDEGQTRNVLSNYITPSATGDYGGDLASSERNLNTLAYQNGLKLSPSQMQGWMRGIAKGDLSESEISQQIRETAAKTFSLYGDQIRGGANLYDVASPYIQAMASTLELNPNDLDLFDKNIRGALTGTYDAKSKSYQPMSITSFEQSLRQDKRWQYTTTAKDQARGYVNALSQAWGLSA